MIGFEYEEDDEHKHDNYSEQSYVPEECEGEYFMIGSRHSEFLLAWKMKENHACKFDRIKILKCDEII